MKTTRVFLSVHSVYARDHRTLRGHRAEWWARGTTTKLYASSVVATPEAARELAVKWLGRQAGRLVDTTTQVKA